MKRNGLPEPEQWIFYTKETDEEHMGELYREITNMLIRRKKAHIALFLNCRGGDIDQAVGFYNFIKAMKINLVTIATGQIASSALVVFLSGTKRYILPDTYFYFHPGNTGTSDGMHPKDAKGAVASFSVQNKVAQQIVARETKLKLEYVKRYDSNTLVMKSFHAIRNGLAHGLIGIEDIPTRSSQKKKNNVRAFKSKRRSA